MLEIRLLGQFEVKLDGQPVEINSRPARLLLAYLALNAGVDHPREDLAGRLWPEADPTAARNNLRNVLYKLRESLKAGPHYLRADSETVTLDLSGAAWLDVAALRARPEAATADLIRTAAVYQGRLLPGFNENWVDVERMRAREAFERRLEILVQRLAAEGRWEDLRDWSSQWIAQVEHTPEAAYRGLMTAHAGLGDFSRVEAAYKACASALKKELNDPEWEPAEATRQLYEQLREGHKHAQTQRRPPPAPAAEPPASKPAPEPQSAGRLFPFLGRERELADITARLADPACRLLTLIGPGGVGKTRLAQQVIIARQAADPAAAVFIPLAAAGTAEAIVAAVAGAVGLAFYGRERPRQQLVDYLREQRRLLALDNFEHLKAHTDLVDELLTAAPGLQILVTSRERLHVPGEWLVEIDGLAYPADVHAPDADAYSAVQLFLQTARRLYSRASFTDEWPEIVRLCQLVEGLPLAIEMAAAWVRALPCAEITRQVEQNLALLARPLPHTPERQHSVRAVFEHSWQLLTETEQNILRRLAVFRGGFQREAAEKIAYAPLALLLSLVDKSLIRRGPAGRFEMHELLRQYAAEKLAEAPEGAAETETRQAYFYLELAAQSRQAFAGLEQEWENLGAGLQAAYRRQLWGVVLGYVESLGAVWLARNRLEEARQAYQWAQTAAQALNHPRSLATVLLGWGRACGEQSDYAEARTHLEQAEQLSRAQPDPAGTAAALYQLGHLAVEQADFPEAEKHLRECQALSESLADEAGAAAALFERARILYHTDQWRDAVELGRQALARQEQLGDQLGSVRTLRLLANACVELHTEAAGAGEYLAQAQACGERARQLCAALQAQDELALVLRSLASVYKQAGDLAAAQAAVEQALSLLQKRGNRRDQAISWLELSMIHERRADFAASLQAAERCLQLCRQLQDQFGSVYALTKVGDAQLRLGEPAQACQVWRAALTAAEAFTPAHPQTDLLRQRLAQNRCPEALP